MSDIVERLCQEGGALRIEAAAEIERLRAENEQARGYLWRNVLAPLHSGLVPLPDLLGVCTQVDNALTEIERLRAALRDAIDWFDKNEQYADPDWYAAARAALAGRDEPTGLEYRGG